MRGEVSIFLQNHGIPHHLCEVKVNHSCIFLKYLGVLVLIEYCKYVCLCANVFFYLSMWACALSLWVCASAYVVCACASRGILVRCVCALVCTCALCLCASAYFWVVSACVLVRTCERVWSNPHKLPVQLVWLSAKLAPTPFIQAESHTSCTSSLCGFDQTLSRLPRGSGSRD